MSALLLEVIGPVLVVWVVAYVCWVGETWERRRWSERLEEQIRRARRD